MPVGGVLLTKNDDKPAKSAEQDPTVHKCMPIDLSKHSPQNTSKSMFVNCWIRVKHFTDNKLDIPQVVKFVRK